uniref:DNA (cytosine-5-)-methyltransferase n=1 Tax=Denticeps clupeoides TaxID=299321 RepID=A0AAY4DP42_9TELE
MVVNVTVEPDEEHSESELLAWLNGKLRTRFTDVGQTRSGAPFCQLIDWLFPGSMDIGQVKFQAKEERDFAHNYNLLQGVLRDLGVKKTLPVEELLQGDFQDSLELLLWFKVFFDRNFVGQKYSPVIVREIGKSDETGDINMDDAEAESLGSFSCSLAMMRFIQKYNPNVPDDFLSQSFCVNVKSVLGEKYPEDLTAVCSQTPYCLYLYPGVSLGDKEGGSVVLLGFFNEKSGLCCVRLLDVLQPTEDSAASELERLEATLKTFKIPVENLSIFYTCTQAPEWNEKLMAGVKAMSPGVVSLCGLDSLAGHACLQGILATGLSDKVQEFISMIASYSACSVTSKHLRELFHVVSKWKNTSTIMTECLLFSRTICRISSLWEALYKYVGNHKGPNAHSQICSYLEDHKLRLLFLFLAYALELLCVFQETLKKGAEVQQILQDASALVKSYAAAFLKPVAVEQYLRKGNESILNNKKNHLPFDLVKVGPQVADYLSQHKEELTAHIDNFHKMTIAFYTALTASVVKSLPLPNSALSTLTALLNPLGRQNVSCKMVAELGSLIGLCQNQKDASQLRDDFLEYQLDVDNEEPCDATASSAEVDWKKFVGKSSIFRKLILSFLALPRVLNVDQVISQVCFCPYVACCTLTNNVPTAVSPNEESIVITDEEDDDDIIWTSTTFDSDGHMYKVGDLVWGKNSLHDMWPGRVKEKNSTSYLVKWFGYSVDSEVNLQPFSAFVKCFCASSFADNTIYKNAVFESLKVTAESCSKTFPTKGNDLLAALLDWAFGGFKHSGPGGLAERAATKGMQPYSQSFCSHYRCLFFCCCTHMITFVEQMVKEVLDNGKNIEDFCLSCGSTEINIIHPLFVGSLCLKCKNNVTETLYRYDDDGYQSYCTVCCAGLEVILCGNHNCCRSFCMDCLNILVGPGTFDRLKDIDPWICYLCEPSNCYGALKPREDWSIRVQEFFANNSAREFEPHRVYPSIPANLRKPIRVLSLFDGIATGYLVLKELGFKVETYVASEIDEDSVAVSMVNHEGKIVHVDDVKSITKAHINEWGPFDLLIGGSPCNDLSIVNPARKGLFEGTGRLFFDYYRLLNMLKPKEDDPRPFFWLFENVVFMANRDKADICRFLECNPVVIDAVKVSPANRARYFWGNLPGMNRPIIASQSDKLSLQECLEIGRTAKFIKVRTITTRSNSLKQGANDEMFPVTMNGKDDNLWVTELEKIFGFPKHYTDVRNMSRQHRQKVLGKSWSVPVIRHLFAPLKDYFACDNLSTSNIGMC